MLIGDEPGIAETAAEFGRPNMYPGWTGMTKTFQRSSRSCLWAYFSTAHCLVLCQRPT